MSEQAQRQLAEALIDKVNRLEAENATLKQERDQIIAERAADRKRDDEVLYHVNRCIAAVVTERNKLLADVDGLTVDRDAAEAERDRLRQALTEIADCEGKTLLGPVNSGEASRWHEIGANKAFNQCAADARRTLSPSETEEDDDPTLVADRANLWHE